MDDHENVDTVELIQCEDGDDQIAREDDEVSRILSSHWFAFQPIRNWILGEVQSLDARPKPR